MSGHNNKSFPTTQ